MPTPLISGFQVAVLLNNAGVKIQGDSFDGLNNWKTVMDVNLFGYVTALCGSCVVDGLFRYHRVLNVQHTFVPVWLSCVNDMGCAEINDLVYAS